MSASTSGATSVPRKEESPLSLERRAGAQAQAQADAERGARLPLALPEESATTTVFVGGLSARVSPQQLRSLFAPFGTVVAVHIPPRRNNCGFVRFAGRLAAEAAMLGLRGYLLCGQPIRLSWGTEDLQPPLEPEPVLQQEERAEGGMSTETTRPARPNLGPQYRLRQVQPRTLGEREEPRGSTLELIRARQAQELEEFKLESHTLRIQLRESERSRQQPLPQQARRGFQLRAPVLPSHRPPSPSSPQAQSPSQDPQQPPPINADLMRALDQL